MIGDLRHRVTLQEAVLTPDGAGGFTTVWQDLADNPVVYADITPLSGTEQLRFQQLQSSVTHRITIRYRPDITPAQRIVFDGKTYDILAVTDRDGQKTRLDILAETR